MTLQLSGQSERVPEPYKEFYGDPLVQMPLLVSGKDAEGNVVDVPRVPLSVAEVLERRLKAPRDVIKTWRDYRFWTGDGSVAGTEGDHLLVLDAQPLRKLTAESELYHSALVLSPETWDELKEQEDKVLYLTAEEGYKLDCTEEGYRRGRRWNWWFPTNNTVGKVWDFLSRGRGRDLTYRYGKLLSTHLLRYRQLRVYLNQTITKNGKPTMRPWVIDSLDGDSSAYGQSGLFSSHERLVGVAQNDDPCRTKSKLEVVLDAFNIKNPTELRKALQLYDAAKNPKV